MGENDCVVWAIDINEINSLLPSQYAKQLQEESAYLFTVEMLDKIVHDLDQYDTDMKDTSFILIEPPSIDQRIINQYSYFSIMPKALNNLETFLDSHTKNTYKYVIDKSLKWEIRDMLDFLNANERILFPGLDGLTAWLKRHYYYVER